MLGQSAFDEMRDALQALEKATKYAKPEELVDCTARLRVFFTHLEELNASWSNTIKAKCETQSSGVLHGKSFTAIAKFVSKMCLNTEAVKKFLGKRLPEFQYDAGSVRLTFKARE